MTGVILFLFLRGFDSALRPATVDRGSLFREFLHPPDARHWESSRLHAMIAIRFWLFRASIFRGFDLLACFQVRISCDTGYCMI